MVLTFDTRNNQLSECCNALTWRKNLRSMNRCTRCGHRKITDGRMPVKTRYRPWRVLSELAGRYQAVRAGVILSQIQAVIHVNAI